MKDLHSSSSYLGSHQKTWQKLGDKIIYHKLISMIRWIVSSLDMAIFIDRAEEGVEFAERDQAGHCSMSEEEIFRTAHSRCLQGSYETIVWNRVDLDPFPERQLQQGRSVVAMHGLQRGRLQSKREDYWQQMRCNMSLFWTKGCIWFFHQVLFENLFLYESCTHLQLKLNSWKRVMRW